MITSRVRRSGNVTLPERIRNVHTTKKEKDHLIDLGVDARILEVDLGNKYGLTLRSRFSCPRAGPMMDSSARGNKPSDSIKNGNYLATGTTISFPRKTTIYGISNFPPMKILSYRTHK